MATRGERVYQTKKDFVYEKLRAEIVSGAVKPGERLILREVAGRLGTSYLPAREAIQRLEVEGFVTSAPHVGARIAFPDLGRIEETLLIRATLETLALRMTAPLLSPADFEDLAEILRESERALKERDGAGLNRLNRAFHLRLIGPCPLPRLKKMIHDLWDASSMSSNLLEFMPQRARQNLQEHRGIVRHLRRGRVDEAEALLSLQRENARKMLRRQFERNGGPSAAPSADGNGRARRRGRR